MEHDDTTAEALSAGIMVAVAIVAGMAEAGSCDLAQTERVATRLAEQFRETHVVAAEALATFAALLELAKPTQ